MPELPEVETMCRGIAPIVGRKVARVFCPPCSFRPIAIAPEIESLNRLVQLQVVSRVSRLGKRVVIHVGGYALILQPKMSGLVLLDHPPDHEHVRLQIDFVKPSNLRLLFWDRRGLGTVECLPQGDVEARIVSGRLGPDALEISFEDFVQRLRQTARPVKVALLDQKLLAGVGNLYASEMLHAAKIHPAKVAAKLTRPKLRLLYEAMQRILITAIAHEGSTLSDGTYRNALNDPGSYQNEHLAYDRAGLPCPTCAAGEIVRIVQAQRSTFYCPKCQRS